MDVDIDAAREYVAWLGERFEAEDRVELERRAAGGFTEPEAISTAAEDAARWRLLLARMLLGPSRTIDRKDELQIAEVIAQLKRDYPSPADAAWAEFLTAHPELEPDTLTAAAVKPGRLVFTDDELVDAIAEAARQWDDHYTGIGAGAHVEHLFVRDIANVLRSGHTQGREAWCTHSDLVRVGQALRRLEAAGRVIDATKRYERQRRWAISPETSAHRGASAPG